MIVRALVVLLALLVAAQADAAITRRFTGTAADAINGGNISPTLGGTTNSGDLVTCAVTQRNATDYTKIAASGYTALAGKNHGSSGTSVILAKIAGAGESDPTITSSDTTSGRTLIGQCTVWAGTLDTVTGIVAHSNTAENAAGFSITTPSLTVTTDNTVVLYVASKANDWNAENPVIGASDALTELGQPERTSSAQVGMVWAYRIQTTAATVTPGDVTLTENSANGWSLAVSIKPAAAAPTLTSVAVTGRTSSSVTVGFTSDQAGTVYSARATVDQTAPTCDELEAQTYAHAVTYASKAVSAGADSIAHTGLTNGTARDFYICTENAGGTDSAVTKIAYVYKLPAWTVAPTVSDCDADSCTVTGTLDGAGTTAVVLCPYQATAPTAEEVNDEDCASAAAPLASATDDASLSQDVGTVSVPVVSIYVAAEYGTQAGGLTTLAGQCLDAPSGKTVINCPTGLTSIDANSPIVTFNVSVTPDIAVGDIPVCDAATTPGACSIVHSATGLYDYDGSCAASQYFDCNFYDLSAGAPHGDTLRTYVNDQDPQPQDDTYHVELPKDVEMASVDFCAALFTDPEGNALTCTSSDAGTGTGEDKLPAGTTFVAGVWSGTPTAAYESAGSFTVTATDVASNTAQIQAFWSIPTPLTMPNCVGLSTSACGALADDLDVAIYPQCAVDAPTATDTIVSQYPASGTTALPGDSLSLAVYLGVCPTFIGPTINNLRFARGVAMPQLDFASRFLMGDGDFWNCTLMQLGGVTDLTTASGAGTNATSLTLASAVGVYPGAWLRIGASTYRRVLAVNWSTNVVTLATSTTWSNGATVSIVTVTVASIPGVNFEGGSCRLSGTPSVSASNSRLVIRATNSAGLSTDSP